MTSLDEKETTPVFEKLIKFTGPNLAHIVNNPSLDCPITDAGHGRYVFRLHKNYDYTTPPIPRSPCHQRFSRPSCLPSTCIGKFNKTGSFCLIVHYLDLIAVHARSNVLFKLPAEMSFLYGNSVLKGGMGRITENTKVGDGVVVFSMSDVPLGFKVVARGTQECRKAIVDAIVVNYQADLGEYLRNEDDL